MICRMNNHRPEGVIDLVYKMWTQQHGRPAKIHADRGPAFIGAAWGELCDLMEIQMVLISRECPFKNGTVERSAGLIKTSYRILKQTSQGLSDERLLIWAAVSRNMIHNLKSGMSPAQIMLGRSDALGMIESRNAAHAKETDEEMPRNQAHRKALVDARQASIQADSA